MLSGISQYDSTPNSRLPKKINTSAEDLPMEKKPPQTKNQKKPILDFAKRGTKLSGSLKGLQGNTLPIDLCAEGPGSSGSDSQGLGRAGLEAQRC